MTLRITRLERRSMLDQSLFISASIPDESRWRGEFDPLEITDAVVSLARTFLTAGWRLVSAAHPTIAPLLLYVAAELTEPGEERVSIYQSQLFESLLPTATRRFEADRIGRIIWTEAAEGDEPLPGRWDRSLELMRRRMLTETRPSAAVFVGGMEGIPDEYRLFADLLPQRPRYAIGRPGGAARDLVGQLPESPLREELLTSSVYPAVWQMVLSDLTHHQ